MAVVSPGQFIVAGNFGKSQAFHAACAAIWVAFSAYIRW